MLKKITLIIIASLLMINCYMGVIYATEGNTVVNEVSNKTAEETTETGLVGGYSETIEVEAEVIEAGEVRKVTTGTVEDTVQEVTIEILEGEYETKEKFAVWERWQPFDPVPEGYTMIFGHTPTINFQNNDPLEICKFENAIGIDCGCGYPEPKDQFGHNPVYGRLACLRLEDMKEFTDCINVTIMEGKKEKMISLLFGFGSDYDGWNSAIRSTIQ